MNLIVMVGRLLTYTLFSPIHGGCLFIVLDVPNSIPVAFAIMASISYFSDVLATIIIPYLDSFLIYSGIFGFWFLYLILTFYLTIDDQRALQKLSSNGKTIRMRTEARINFYYENLVETVQSTDSNHLAFDLFSCFVNRSKIDKDLMSVNQIN